MRTAWRYFVRNRRSTAAAVCAAAALMVFLLVYADNIRLSENELEHAYESIPVDAYIEGSSPSELPELSGERYDDILTSGFVAEHRAMAWCRINERDILRGVDHMMMDTALAESGIEWAEGYDDTVFAGQAPICIASRSLGLDLGDTYTATLRVMQSIVFEMEVVGLYGDVNSIPDGSGAMLYCPLGYLKNSYETAGLTFTYCGLEMILCNTECLGEFKTKMQNIGMDKGAARLVINDSLLAGVTTQLQRQIRLLNSLLPLLFVFTVLIGFALSFLLLCKRKRDAAVMRSLGMKRSGVFFTLLSETALQGMSGVLLGIAVSVLIAGHTAVKPSFAVMFFVCWLLGGAAAVTRLASVNVLKLMTEKE